MKSEKIIEVIGLKKSFRNRFNTTNILNGINFTVDKGEFVSIMGASGCGKSTLLYLLGGLDTPSEGIVSVMGNNLSLMSDKNMSKIRNKEIGFVFQFYNLVQNLTVEENILLPLKMMKNKDRSEFNEIVEIMGIRNILKKYPNQLSGGQQQRVAIARAVITKPNVILADEPTGNLDSSNGEAVMELFKKINQCKNITIIQVTHDEDKAEYGDRLIRLKDGRVVEDTQL
ncbi:ABC transporter ATP-binding protein [Streptococcus cristatus]|uniref:ABC transporter ATP-binding protein n=1 Tax=Streptococcus cristatus TaxID=45634 RepID=UPI000F65B873|nr:ABC transporter ATP-binding protein [Streptococcus cristatus]RSJ73037.1 Bacitracin export ATP-binding protein BceA [Streptococcus cristatus]